MFTKEACIKGAQKRAAEQREKALKTYYESPNICLECNKVIHVKPKEKIRDVKKRKFCSNLCRNKNKKVKLKTSICLFCHKTFTHHPRRKRKFCSNLCKNNSRATVNLTTKKELLMKRKNYQSFRSSIRKRAEVAFKNSSKPKSCVICGYDKHYEVSHIKPVSDFSDDSFVKDINAIDNLIALCPNHHWEFDNNRLSKSSKNILRREDSNL